MGPDHEHAPVVPEHAELLIERYDSAGAGGLELSVKPP
jgi:hypothetical protein